MLLLLIFALLPSLAAAQTLAIRNVTIIDVNGGEARRATVLISGSRISSVGTASAAIPKQAKIVDGSGKFLIPGLWDMHVHLWDSDPMFDLYVANGVTGVRDMGSDYAKVRSWAAAAEKAEGPRVFTPGSPVDGPGNDNTKMRLLRVQTPEDGRRATDTLDTQGVDFIKVMSNVPHDAYVALAQRARLRRAIFAGHVPESVSVKEALEARQRSMEHLFGMALACSADETNLRTRRFDAILRRETATVAEVREKTYATYSEGKCIDLLRQMARFDVWQVPTLIQLKRLALLDLDKMTSDSAAKAVPEKIRKTWEDPMGDLKNATTEQLTRFREGYAFHTRMVALMARQGVGLLAGTDSGDPYIVPGFALHKELELLVEAGLKPLQALQAATINPARFFGLEKTTGSIEKLKTADLVLLSGNPLTDIRNTRKIEAVIIRGRLLDRKRLDRMLTSN